VPGCRHRGRFHRQRHAARDRGQGHRQGHGGPLEGAPVPGPGPPPEQAAGRGLPRAQGAPYRGRYPDSSRERLRRAAECRRPVLSRAGGRRGAGRSPMTLAAAHVTRFLEAHQLPFRVVAPRPTMPNIVGSFEGAKPGLHLVLNGHMDVFPADEENERWTHGPWSGTIADGKIYGRGVADMKAGTSASVFTYAYLYRVRDHLKGRLTLTAVSDEETFGPWGARYLMEHHPEVHGDCLLNGEPSSPLTVRFVEKVPLWRNITVRMKGAHGAYTHLSPSATKLAARLILDLEELTTLQPSLPSDVAKALAGAVAAIDEAQGPGAKDIVP